MDRAPAYKKKKYKKNKKKLHSVFSKAEDIRNFQDLKALSRSEQKRKLGHHKQRNRSAVHSGVLISI